jgi:DNA-binding transcriptional ArsR family regulator
VSETRSAPVFAALGEESRLRIVGRLSRDGPLSIARLTDDANITRQAVTKHLRALEGAGLVRSRRAGRERIWELRLPRIAEAHRALGAISRRLGAPV